MLGVLTDVCSGLMGFRRVKNSPKVYLHHSVFRGSREATSKSHLLFVANPESFHSLLSMVRNLENQRVDIGANNKNMNSNKLILNK